jgi:uncharacterized phage-associated protein
MAKTAKNPSKLMINRDEATAGKGITITDEALLAVFNSFKTKASKGYLTHKEFTEAFKVLNQRKSDDEINAIWQTLIVTSPSKVRDIMSDEESVIMADSGSE